MTSLRPTTFSFLIWLAINPLLVSANDPDDSKFIVNADGSAFIRIDSSHYFASAFLDSDTYS
ncbi:MAG: hypothetical protein KJN90_10665, partial [Gammaproteobacteria bacterium]|nr:hypothetical protein [Gammaproteobacteria bacterium]